MRDAESLFLPLVCKKKVLIVCFGRTCYWYLQLVMACVRYVFVMYPTHVHNLLPNYKYKNKLFIWIFK